MAFLLMKHRKPVIMYLSFRLETEIFVAVKIVTPVVPH